MQKENSTLEAAFSYHQIRLRHSACPGESGGAAGGNLLHNINLLTWHEA
jgi:hypothetical protein